MAENQRVTSGIEDKVVLAEDLIYWYLTDRWPSVLPHSSNKTDANYESADRYSKYACNGLDTIKRAVDFLDQYVEPSVCIDFVSMRKASNVSTKCFIQYANRYHEHYFSRGFEAKYFLKYCTRLANLAGYFYVSGNEHIIPFTVNLIVKALPDGDMFINGAWHALEKAAEIFVNCNEKESSELSSNDTSSSESSDSSSESSDCSIEVNDSSISSIELNISNMELNDSATEVSRSSIEICYSNTDTSSCCVELTSNLAEK